jgi:mannan endo-1,4-beta-mannosidase
MTKKASADRNDTLLREITLGLWDSTLTTFATQVKQINETIYLRFGYEMNGDWFAWGGKSKDFILAWKHARKIFEAEQVSNVLWVFSPGVLWDGATVNNNLLNYYPGDSVVDIIGLDGYNFGDIVKDGYQLHWKSFQDVFGTSLRAFGNIDKPIWITEIGCPTDDRRSDWLKDVFNFMGENPCVGAMLWFNAHKSNEPDFELSSDSVSLDLVKKWLSK